MAGQKKKSTRRESRYFLEGRKQRNKKRRQAAHKKRIEKKLAYLKRRLEGITKDYEYTDALRHIAPKLGREVHDAVRQNLSSWRKK